MFTLKEALDAIKGKPEFVVIEKKDYVVIDYNLEKSDTFFDPKDTVSSSIRINLRGAAFNKETGEIVSLPFHKFRNLGECEGYMPSDIDFNNIECVMLKLDGSMIRTIETSTNDRGWVFGTRAGETDVSAFVDEYFNNLPEQTRRNYEEYIIWAIEENHTPIFEFTSRKNKVVIDYPEPSLTLLALRSNEFGTYVPHSSVAYISKLFAIPTVQTYTEFNPENVKAWKDAEGVVVRLANSGFMFKVKAEDYVMRHRAKDLVKFEKDVIALILEGKIDDILPLIPDEKPQAPKTIGDLTSEREKLRLYRDYVLRCITREEHWIKTQTNVLQVSSADRKEFAKKVNSMFPNYSSFFFNVYNGREAGVKEHLLKNCTSSTKIEEALKLFRIDGWNR